ncbi:MAG: FHA domain-containing protein [Deltaproteobacteria bacterium]|nr:FHA domain-containing protein [Deltaproteobacteria bacterium]
MADEDNRDPMDQAPEDGTLIDSDLVGEAVNDAHAPQPVVTVGDRDEVPADDGGSPTEDESTVMVEVEPDEDSTVMEDLEEEPANAEDEDDDSQSTVLIESPFMDEKPEPPAPEALLTVSFGNDSGKEFTLSTRTLVVGRSLDADIVLNDPSVSRKHFEIHHRDGEWVLKDLGSVNGTKLDGQRVQGEGPLAEGNQIEAGQTLMKFSSDEDQTRALEQPVTHPSEEATIIAEAPSVGQVNMPFSPRIEVTDTPPDEEKKPFPVIALVIGLLALLVAGVGIAQFGFGVRLLPIGPDPEVVAALKAEADAAQAKADAQDLNNLGLVAFQAKEWDRAVKLFAKAWELDPGIEGLKANLDRSKEELISASRLVDGKAFMEKGEVDQAVRQLQKVEDSSFHYPEARQLLDAINSKQIDAEIDDIRALVIQRKKTDAKETYLALLERHPDDDRVINLRDELVGSGIRLDPPRRKVKARPVTTDGGREKATAPAPRARRKTSSKGKSRVDVNEALQLYNNGSFHQASEALHSAAGSSRGAEAKRAGDMARRIEQFATAYNGGKSALKSKRLDKAEQGLSLALRLDHGINRHYEAEIRGYLGDTYRGRAAAAIQNTDYVLAAKSARKALSYKGDDHLARTIMDKCISVASRYYEQADADLKDGNRTEARDKLKMVLDIVPSSHQLADKASELMQKTR